MAVDISKLSRGEQIISVSGIVLLVFSFFNWYKIDEKFDPQGIGGGVSGWDTTLGWLAVLIGIIMVAQIAATKFGGMKMPDLGSVTWGQIHLGLGALAGLCMVVRLISIPGVLGFDEAYDRTIWLFVAFIAGLGLAGGAYLKFQAEKSGGGALPPRPPAA